MLYGFARRTVLASRVATPFAERCKIGARAKDYFHACWGAVGGRDGGGGGGRSSPAFSEWHLCSRGDEGPDGLLAYLGARSTLILVCVGRVLLRTIPAVALFI